MDKFINIKSNTNRNRKATATATATTTANIPLSHDALGENDWNEILDRTSLQNEFIQKLIDFEKNKYNNKISRGFYIYGDQGIGKTEFVLSTLKKLNYDIIYYDASDVRNKQCVEMLNNRYSSDINVLSMMSREKTKRIHRAIVMDEIEGLNSGDKGGLNTLIKMIRPKKTKRQQLEDTTMTPIICIGNYHLDKKIKELIKSSTSFSLKTPTYLQMMTLIRQQMPHLTEEDKRRMCSYVNGNLRRLNDATAMYRHSCQHHKSGSASNPTYIPTPAFLKLQNDRIMNEYTKDLVDILLSKKVSINEHSLTISETDRTIVSLILHENIVDELSLYRLKDKDRGEKDKKNVVIYGEHNSIEENNKWTREKEYAIEAYEMILEGFSLGDYIDRLTFQRQLWIFNEISSLLKTIRSNHCLMNYKNKIQKLKQSTSSHSIRKDKQTLLLNDSGEKTYYLSEHRQRGIENEDKIRFTKILTKYSTEYNNGIFIQDLCNKLVMDKKDMLLYFTWLLQQEPIVQKNQMIELETLGIVRLDINRIERILQRYNYIIPNTIEI